MEGLKHIALILLVNILILIGHNLLPHQHHVPSLSHPSSTECPSSHECPDTHHKHHDEDAGTKNCHAFNDISFVKYNAARLPSPERLSSFMIIRDPGAVPEIAPGVTYAAGDMLKLIIPISELTGTHSLRGPPVLA